MGVKDKICNKYYADGSLERICQKASRKNKGLLGDLIHEVYLILASKSESQLAELEVSGKLKSYIYRTACNQFNSKTSPFYFKYKKFINLSNELDYERI